MIVILTALEIEYLAVKKHLRNLRWHQLPAGTYVEIGHLKDEPQAQVVLAAIGMGTANAAALTERVIAEFAPAAVLFVGIAGGMRDWLALGDVVVANRIYAYQGGRIDQDRYQARPRAWDTNHRLLELARLVHRSQAWPGAKKKTAPSIHFEPVAAGDVVLNSVTAPESDRLRLHYNDAVAVETESSGVALAAHLSESTPVVAIRGIGDHAGGGEGKFAEDAAGWQPTAAANAAAFAAGLVAAAYRQAAPRQGQGQGPIVDNSGAYIGMVDAGDSGKVKITQRVINGVRSNPVPAIIVFAVVIALLGWGTWGLFSPTAADDQDSSSTTAAGTVGLLSVSDKSACGLRTDHTAICWGQSAEYLRPEGRFTSVATRNGIACGLREDGTATCWDSDGAHTTTGPSPTPREEKEIPQPGPRARFTAVTAGCGVLRDGKVTCWDEDKKVNGDDGTDPTGTFSMVTASMYDAVCGVRTDATIHCWGDDDLKPPSGTFRTVSVGGHHACGLRTDDSVTCWGRNDRGQTVAPKGTFRAVSAGEEHSCGLRTDNTIACWGKGNEGATTPPDGTFAVLGQNTGGEYSCALREDGRAECWGQSGDIDVPADRLLVR